MSKFIVLTEIKTKSKQEREFYQAKYNTNTSVKLFESFEEAYSAMRNEVTEKIKSCKFFPWKRGNYTPMKDYLFDVCDDPEDECCKGISQLYSIVKKTLSDPTYVLPKTFIFSDVDKGDWYFAFVSDKTGIIVDHYDDTLRFDVHLKRESAKNYYFSFEHYDEEEEDVVCGITIRLFPISE